MSVEIYDLSTSDVQSFAIRYNGQHNILINAPAGIQRSIDANKINSSQIHTIIILSNQI